MILRRLIAYARARDGVAAAEFALVLPLTLFLSLGAISVSLMAYAYVNMHQAIEATARYAVVQTDLGNTPTQSTLYTYYGTQYFGPVTVPSASFTYNANFATAPCKWVQAKGNYKLFGGVIGLTVPMTATACFPN